MPRVIPGQDLVRGIARRWYRDSGTPGQKLYSVVGGTFFEKEKGGGCKNYRFMGAVCTIGYFFEALTRQNSPNNRLGCAMIDQYFRTKSCIVYRNVDRPLLQRCYSRLRGQQQSWSPGGSTPYFSKRRKYPLVYAFSGVCRCIQSSSLMILRSSTNLEVAATTTS